MAKEEKKTTFGDKYLNALKSGKAAFINSTNRKNDDKLQYAGENNTVNYREALRRANTTVDPYFRAEASDNEDGPSYEEPVLGRRSIDERIEKANERIEELGAAVDERVEAAEKEIILTMDEKESDILFFDQQLRGYDVVMQRTADPEKAKSIDDLNVMLGGKKVSVFKELEGESVRTDSPMPEYSAELAKKAAREMALFGVTDWERGVREVYAGPEQVLGPSADDLRASAVNDAVASSFSQDSSAEHSAAPDDTDRRLPMKGPDLPAVPERLPAVSRGEYSIGDNISSAAAGEEHFMGENTLPSAAQENEPLSNFSLHVDTFVGKTPVSAIVRSDKDMLHMFNGRDAVYVPGGKYISRAEWDKIYEGMERVRQSSFAYTREDGTVVKCWISAKHNGKDMAIDGFGNANNTKDKFPYYDQMSPDGTRKSRGWDTIYREMLSNNKQMYSTTTIDGGTYEFSLNVTVDGERAKIDHFGVLEGEAVGDTAPKVFISRSAYADGIERAANDPSLSGQSQVSMPDGKKLDFKVKAAVDGKEAVPNIPVVGDDVRQYKNGGIMIGREFAQKAIDKMETEKSTFCRLTARDGKEFRFTREGRLTLFVNGKEFSRFANNPERRKGYKAVVCEITGILNTPQEEKKGMEVRAKEEQKTIAIQRLKGQLPYTMSGHAVRGIGSELQKEKMASDSALSSILRAIGGAGRSTGR